MIQKILIVILSILILTNCNSKTKKEDKPDLPDVSFQAPNIRIDLYQESRNIRGKGSVDVSSICGESCSDEKIKTISPSDLKSLSREGEWEEYDEKEKEGSKEKYTVLIRKGTYEKNKREGIWIQYYEPLPGEELIKLKEITFDSNNKEGVEKKFNKTGVVIEETIYSTNVKNGKYWKKMKASPPKKDITNDESKEIVIKDEDDGKASNEDKWIKSVEGQYKNGKKTGKWTEYYPSNSEGVLKSVTEFYEDLKDGKEIIYYPDGKTKSSEGAYIKNMKNGVWKFFYDIGKVEMEGEYKAEAAAKPSDNDEDKSTMKSNLKDDTTPAEMKSKKIGTWKKYYKSGDLFSEGQKGTLVTKNPDGEDFIRDNALLGEWKYYFKGKKLHAKGTMANDMMMDNGEIYDENGKITGRGKIMVSIIKIDPKTDSMSGKLKPGHPFTYFKDGHKDIEVMDVEINGGHQGYQYDDNGNKIGEGPLFIGIDVKKNGCWTEKGKKVYYIMGKVNEGAIAKMTGCK